MTLFRAGFSAFVLMIFFSQLQAEDELSQFVAAKTLFESSLAGNIDTFLEVPAFLHRTEDAKALLKETLESPAFRASAPEVKGRLFMQATTIAHREKQLDQAVAYLKQALPLLPPGRHQQLAKQQLMKVNGQ